MKVICAWCGLLIRDGDPKLPISHGLCVNCKDKLEQDL
jgi:hypothetical protein